MPGIGLITNPRARANVRDPTRIRQLGYLLGSRGEAEATRSLDDLYRVAETFRRERIDLLAINGGDGTIHVTLTAFVQTYGDEPLPPVALLRGGTMNMVATSLGIAGDPGALLLGLVDRYHAREELTTTRRNLLQVGDVYGFIFGTGLIAAFLQAYYAAPRPSPARAALILARAVASAIGGGAFGRRLFARLRAQVWADGQRWAVEDYLTVFASCVEQLGFGFRPFPRAGERPGAFQVLGIHCTPLALVTELGRIFRGRPLRRDKTIDELVGELRLEADAPIAHTIDGDLYPGARVLSVRAGPEVSFVLP